jgi:hypothetical protein
MTDFSVRSDSVDVEQIMRQIRARIREKRGVDYTEEEIRELASVKLEKFLDPRGVRSDLLDQFRRSRAAMPAPQNFAFEESTLYETHRGIVRWIRKILNPILKLFFNPNPLIQALHIQSELNTRNAKREELDALHYEVLHNLVLELTRLGIEVKNLKMRVESMSSRLDFDERRARALEGVVMYRPGSATPPTPRSAGHGGAADAAARAGPATAPKPVPTRAQRRPGLTREAAAPESRPPGARPRRFHPTRRPSREARGRGSALRRRHQRRRRAARAVHRGTARPPRRGRGRHDVRARLRDLAQRGRGGARADQRRRRAALPGPPRARPA